MAPAKQTTSKPSAKVGEPTVKGRKLSFGGIARSPIFKVIVGPASRVHVMHSSLLAAQSSVLYELVNNGMKESKDRSVTWPDVSEHTFSKFLEFAYTGTFIIEDPRKAAKPTNTSQNAPANGERDKTTKCPYWFTLYVDLCVFAECYGVEKLLAATMSALKAVPFHLTPDPAQGDLLCTAVGRLFEDCFTKSVPDRLQSMVSSDVEEHGTALWRDPAFEGIVKQSNALTYVFIDCLAGRKKVVQTRCSSARCKLEAQEPATNKKYSRHRFLPST
ncbi:hypothetical protein CC79DRAFT_1063719 [Sarocladium strictum]